MNPTRRDHLNQVLHHLYVSPLEQCNLCCAMCYTQKTEGRLSNQQMLGFINRYRQLVDLQSITFCGGEVFILPDFPGLVNQLTQEGIYVQIITNGTINRLHELHEPHNINMIVSIDGLPEYHDKNRGVGNADRSLSFLKTALDQGFHAEVFSIITNENMRYINKFENFIQQYTNHQLDITYHPRKPQSYLQLHPTSNRQGTTVGFSCISTAMRNRLAQKQIIFPPKNLGCYQPSLMSDGKIYACCEGIHPLGDLNDDPQKIIQALRDKVKEWEKYQPSDTSLGCVEPEFVCGLRVSQQEETCH